MGVCRTVPVLHMCPARDNANYDKNVRSAHTISVRQQQRDAHLPTRVPPSLTAGSVPVASTKSRSLPVPWVVVTPCTRRHITSTTDARLAAWHDGEGKDRGDQGGAVGEEGGKADDVVGTVQPRMVRCYCVDTRLDTALLAGCARTTCVVCLTVLVSFLPQRRRIVL